MDCAFQLFRLIQLGEKHQHGDSEHLKEANGSSLLATDHKMEDIASQFIWPPLAKPTTQFTPIYAQLCVLTEPPKGIECIESY